ncbi:glycosyltransferase [Saccharothrix isguenensis]
MLVRNRLEYTRRALASLARASGDFEIVVVDNGSDDGTAEYLAALEHERPIAVLRHEDDRGGSERRNVGAAVARGEFLFFLDNDVLVDDPDVVDVLAAELTADPGLGAVSPLLLYPGEVALVQCAGGGSTADGRIGPVGRGRPPGPEHRQHREQTWAPTAALMVRHSSFRRVGGFDEAFDPVSLCEDIDLCCRLRAGGERLRHLGSVAMRHFEGTTFNHVGHDKLPIWKRHMRVIRSRWADVFATGPEHTAADLEWVPVEKDYSDLDRPRVSVLSDPASASADLSFFASDRVLATAEPADVRVVVVGAGAVPALPGVRVVGVTHPDAVEPADHRMPWVLLDATRLVETVPAEGVVVRAPSSAAVLTALRRGLHVLVGKDSVDDVVVEAARKAPGRCSVDLPWAHHSDLTALGKAVTEGSAGAPRGFEVRLDQVSTGRDLVAELGPDVLDVVDRVLGAPVTGVRTVEATHDRVRAVAVAGGVTGTVELGWGEPRFHLAVTGVDGALAADLVASPVDGAYADFVGALRGGPTPLTDLGAVGGLFAVVSAWRSEVAALLAGEPGR